VNVSFASSVLSGVSLKWCDTPDRTLDRRM
jgi:hypothetical protein